MEAKAYNPLAEQIDYPWLIFTLGDRHFAINSEMVSTIMLLPGSVAPLPDASGCVRGIYDLRGSIVTLVEMRRLMGMNSIMEEYQDFSNMLEARKQDHIRWVEELERSLQAGEPFTLATDPHQCAFGKWYDSYTSEVHSISHHLKKIETPHALLHKAALDVNNCKQDCPNCKRPECLKNVLARVKGQYAPVIIGLLDEAKEVFRSGFHEMVIVLDVDGQKLGIIADEVLAVEMLAPVCGREDMDGFQAAQYIAGVTKSEKFDWNILMVDSLKLVETINQGV